MIKTENKIKTTVNNTYDAKGFRVKKEVVDGDTVIYHYLPSGLLLFTTNVTSGETVDNIFAGGILLASYNSTFGNMYHYYGDRMGNVRVVSDENGVTAAKYDYLPYGQVLPDPTNDDIDNVYTFSGLLGVQDEGNGIFYMQQRFYDASSARFLSRDPLGFAAGSNLYAFGHNNPAIYADPDGEIAVVTALAIGFGVYAAAKVVSYGINAIKESMDEIEKRDAAARRYYDSLRRHDFKAARIHYKEYGSRYASSAANTVKRAGQVIVNTAVEGAKQLVPGGNTAGGYIAKELITDQVGDAIKQPILDSFDTEETQETESSDSWW
jgi:RHS repeat-associated protein